MHSDFPRHLKTWRRLNGIKQAALAEMLGVSQAAISFWESGRDTPAPGSMKRLKALMAHTARDEVRVERLFVQRQAGVRALFDLDGIRFIAASQGFQSLWPETSAFEGRFMADALANEARALIFGPDLRPSVLAGNLALASGVSERMTDLQTDEAIRFRWHICFRRYGPRTLVDVVYEPCAPDLSTGITDLVYLDAGTSAPSIPERSD
ncbi:helix-turn-helix transcriptional regulator [Aquabacter cavernae]|uniref:helix-turn-helix transcriptional regulator n=1 Tax=Aquabacter cavernae TaxID=2496029 RepID=UPI000F8C7B59|nr:helix-turn-helix transcriptional regulator [Aquabacter cavernae]